MHVDEPVFWATNILKGDWHSEREPVLVSYRCERLSQYFLAWQWGHLYIHSWEGVFGYSCNAWIWSLFSNSKILRKKVTSHRGKIIQARRTKRKKEEKGGEGQASDGNVYIIMTKDYTAQKSQCPCTCTRIYLRILTQVICALHCMAYSYAV